MVGATVMSNIETYAYTCVLCRLEKDAGGMSVYYERDAPQCRNCHDLLEELRRLYLSHPDKETSALLDQVKDRIDKYVESLREPTEQGKLRKQAQDRWELP